MTPAATYQHGPDSQRHPGVPQGDVTHFTHVSMIFPSTRREYWVYVPKQYDSATPAAVMVFQDGHAYLSEDGPFRVPIVFDNLIHAGTMPATIGIFINPGHVGDELPANTWNASNRSFEYDSLSDQYARFLLEEILPAVGAQWKLSDDPEQRDLRAIVGRDLRIYRGVGAPRRFPRGYDHTFAPGTGAHNAEHGGAILPDSLRWLWRDSRSR
jgi:enterochelin esterase-like enzyme